MRGGQLCPLKNQRVLPILPCVICAPRYIPTPRNRHHSVIDPIKHVTRRPGGQGMRWHRLVAASGLLLGIAAVGCQNTTPGGLLGFDTRAADPRSLVCMADDAPKDVSV